MSRTEQIEIERKYDVSELSSVPDLSGVATVARAETDEPFTLRAVYYDSAEHVLLGNRITLRRREGGHDQGWHLKLPGGEGARREEHSPLGASDTEPLPATLRNLVEVVLRGRPVHPVLVLETRRTVTRLLDGDGTQLAELADDEVTATNPDSASVRSWREWEVELAEGVRRSDGEALLDALGDALERAGAEVSASKSKLARGLGEGASSFVAGSALSESGVSALAEPGETPPGRKSAGRFVLDALAPLVDDLQTLDGPVRDGDQEALHVFRTTLRRVQAILRVYRGVVDDEASARLVTALRTVTRAAGPVRDAQVASQKIRDAEARGSSSARASASSAGSGLVEHQAVERILAALAERERDAAADLVGILADASYFQLLDELDLVLASTPKGARAADDVKKFVAARLSVERKRVRRRVAAGSAALAADAVAPGAAEGLARAAAGSDADHDTSDAPEGASVPPRYARAAVHAARKAARRLRYANEAARDVGLSREVRVSSVKAAHRLQAVVGEALDASDALRLVLDQADAARRAAEDTFTYGVLAAGLAADRDRALARLPRAAKAL